MAAAHAVLTTASRLTCLHKGLVMLTSGQHLLTVDGNPVILRTDLIGATVAGCTNPSPGTPCSKVTSILAGASPSLSVGGAAVMTEAAFGLTDGQPALPVLWQVSSAGQTKLRVA